MAFWAGFSSYCYSDVIAGRTDNAAEFGLTWDMGNILPPEAGLTINGMYYTYSVEKDPESDMQVHIQNEHALEDGYIIRKTDDWSQLPGSTIVNGLTFGDLPAELFGQGSIQVDGEGQVSDPSVRYSYRYDECYVPISNPECPGYEDAMYDWLKENGLLDQEPDVNDPFYDEWVQLTLGRESESEDEEENVNDRKDEEEEDSGIEALNADVDIEGFVDGATQAAIMNSFATIPNFEGYYTTSIQGGVYEDVLILEDGDIQDNQRALSNLAQQQLHRDMVRSQYD